VVLLFCKIRCGGVTVQVYAVAFDTFVDVNVKVSPAQKPIDDEDTGTVGWATVTLLTVTVAVGLVTLSQAFAAILILALAAEPHSTLIGVEASVVV
jgi:hypothetical protein